MQLALPRLFDVETLDFPPPSALVFLLNQSFGDAETMNTFQKGRQEEQNLLNVVYKPDLALLISDFPALCFLYLFLPHDQLL